jgi:UDP-N-acetylglucosamine enolpyruvyl transferase
MIAQMVEQIARMNQQQRAEFVEVLADKWPGLANDLQSMISLQLTVDDFDRKVPRVLQKYNKNNW